MYGKKTTNEMDRKSGLVKIKTIQRDSYLIRIDNLKKKRLKTLNITGKTQCIYSL
jgi:hypothetical protein